MSFTDQSNGLVWKRSVADNEDVWDDRALIEAYDKAVKEVNRRITDKTNELGGTESGDKSVANAWHCRQYCRCVFSEDGIEYEAQIVDISAANDACLVRYIGYGNEEIKSFEELKPSHGKRARSLQIRHIEAQEVGNDGSDIEYDNSSRAKTKYNETENIANQRSKSDSHNPFIPPIPNFEPTVPPPLPSISDLPSDEESLASMLMSWYMSGYHTGYYRALKQCRQSSNK